MRSHERVAARLLTKVIRGMIRNENDGTNLRWHADFREKYRAVETGTPGGASVGRTIAREDS